MTFTQDDDLLRYPVHNVGYAHVRRERRRMHVSLDIGAIFGPKPPALVSYDRLVVPIKTTRGQALLSATLVDH
jgi:hypothetical protein